MGAGPLDGRLEAAVRHHQAGRLAEAAALYREALAERPNDPDVLHLLGIVTFQTGQGGQMGAAERALEYLDRAVSLRPDSPDFRSNFGNVLKAVGRLGEAVVQYRAALALRPAFADAHNNLANALHDQGKLKEAVTHYETALRLAPGSARVHNNLGVAYKDQGRLAEAQAQYEKAIAIEPAYADAHNNLGNILMEQGALDEAVKRFEWVLSLRPDFAEAHVNLGNLYREQGRLDAAAGHLRQALALDPRSAAAHNNLGNVLKAQGKLGEAVASYERAIENKPDWPTVYYNLAELRRTQKGDPAFGVLEPLARDRPLPPDEAINLHFALGKMYDDIGDHAAAFRAYRRGNGLRRQQAERRGQRFDVAEHRRRVERIMETFTESFFAERRDFGLRSDLPVLIVGMPRSGTTLVEQILSSHPDVIGAGELPHMGAVADGLAGTYPDGVAAMDAAASRELADRYLKHLSNFSDGSARVTDKMPDNFLLLGLVALLLPGARIIHCRRDPLDTCLSCYFKHFTHGQDFTNDLRDLGHYYRAYERLMAHWRETLPLPVLDVDYEDLVAHQEKASRRIVEFCGLAWDGRCLDFHKNARLVHTASNVQVRRKIFSTSVGRWQRYGRYLAPLREALDSEALDSPE